MSVQTNLQLPTEPSGGSIRTYPLAGDGYVSPRSYTHVQLRSNGDAGGGYNAAQIRFDPRYTQVVAYVGIQVQNASSATEFVASIITQRENTTLGPIITGSISNNSLFSGPPDGIVWQPPALLVVAEPDSSDQPPYVKAETDNLGASTGLWLSVLLWNFNRLAPDEIQADKMLQVLSGANHLAGGGL